MTRRRLLFLGLAVAIGLAAIAWFLRRDTERKVEHGDARSVEATSEAVGEALSGSHVNTVGDATRPLTNDNREMRSLASNNAPTVPFEVRGTIRVVSPTRTPEEGGAPNIRKLDGTLTLRLDDAESPIEVLVVDGKWSLEGVVARRMHVLDGSLQGQRLLIAPEEFLFEPGKLNVVALRAEQLSLPALRLRSTDPAVAIEEPEVLWEYFTNGDDEAWPPDPERLLPLRCDVRGNLVRLPQRVQGLWLIDQPRLLVRAKGMAWTSVVVDCTKREEHVVLLERAGALEVIVEGAATPGDLRIELRGGGEPPRAIRAPVGGAGRCGIEALKPGRYALTVAGLGKRDRIECANCADIVVSPGATTDVTLRVLTGPKPGLSDISGTLRVPKGWPLDAIVLKLCTSADVGNSRIVARSLGTAQFEVLHEDAQVIDYAWKLLDVRADRYWFEIDPAGYEVRELIVVPNDHPIALELPPPRNVRISVVDADTDMPPAGEHFVIDSGVGVNSRKRLESGETVFEFRAPGDVLDVYVPGGGPYGGKYYLSMEATWPLSPTRNDLTLWVTSTAGIVVYMNDEALKQYRAGTTAVHVFPIHGGSGTVRRTVNAPKGVNILLSEPGDYRVEIVDAASQRVRSWGEATATPERMAFVESWQKWQK